MAISKIFESPSQKYLFRVKVQTETLDAFEYLQRRFLVPMLHDYIIKPVSTLNRHEVDHDHRVCRRVQCFDILFSKSAIRRLVFPSYGIAVLCTLSRLFVWFGLYSGFVCFAFVWPFMFYYCLQVGSA